MLKNFFTKMAQVPKDLLLHYLYGSLYALPLTIMFGWHSVWVVFCIAASKEIIDFIVADTLNKKLNPKLVALDLFATTLPALFFNLVA